MKTEGRGHMDNRRIIQESLNYIEDNLQTEITAAELAEKAGFSLFHFYRLFQQATGLPVMQYILRRRLLHGVYAMKQGRSKTDASLLYGFDTYAGFYKAFCREFGATPSEFLASSRAKRPWRIDITKEETMTITHKKAARILKHWDLENEEITDIYYEGTGNKNDNACYVGQEYILKYTANLGKLKKHIEVSLALESIGLMSAVPVSAADGARYIQEEGIYFYLTRRLPGKQLTAHRFGQGDGRFVGEIIGQLHLALRQIDDCVTEADLLATVRDWALPRGKEILGLSEDFCRDYIETFGELYPKLPRQIIHRDPNPGNIIRADDQWGFIDFELAERNARIYDPCYAATAVLSETFGRDNEKWLEIFRDIIRGYDSVATLTEAERQAIPYVILANQLVCVAWFSEQEKYAEIFETNKKMTAWLISRFAELKNI
ncbi:MAG: helix-turn-helix domain-containing protein [Oscillospiraceae bacterium]|nr:helix-turn-helix domain-containing protein [Oscillospiraceae bacterium]